MRHNFIGGASSTGGTGALTLVSSRGLALPSEAFTADQLVEYSVVQYTSSDRTALAMCETGFGKVSAGDVLTRSLPRSSWNGTDYVQSSVSPINFGTSNVEVMVSPIAEAGPTSVPRLLDTSGQSGGMYQALAPSNMVDGGDFAALAMVANVTYCIPILLAAGFPISQLGVTIQTAAAGKLLSMAIASVSPSDGGPDVTLLQASGVSAGSTGTVFASVGPKLLAPGWYWFLINSDGAPSIRGSTALLPGPMGGLVNQSRNYRYMQKAMNYGAFGADPRANFTGSWTNINNLSAIAPLMR